MMDDWFAKLIVVGLALVVLAACADAGPAQSPAVTATLPAVTQTLPALATESAPTPERTFAVVDTLVPEETIGESMKPIPETPYIANLVQQAQQDLARRLGVPSESIEFLEFEDVVWPDASLGCPMPGMAYTQVMVEGYRILLQHEGQVYAYHGGAGRAPFWCQNPQK
jgi:hypothetical protein